MNAIEFQEQIPKVLSYAKIVIENLEALSGDGSFIHERNRNINNIEIIMQQLQRAIAKACKPNNPEWLDSVSTTEALTRYYYLWRNCDTAMGWMLRISKGIIE